MQSSYHVQGSLQLSRLELGNDNHSITLDCWGLRQDLEGKTLGDHRSTLAAGNWSPDENVTCPFESPRLITHFIYVNRTGLLGSLGSHVLGFSRVTGVLGSIIADFVWSFQLLLLPPLCFHGLLNMLLQENAYQFAAELVVSLVVHPRAQRFG